MCSTLPCRRVDPRRTIPLVVLCACLATACTQSAPARDAGQQPTDTTNKLFPPSELPAEFVKASTYAVDDVGPDPACAAQQALTLPSASVAWTTYALGDFEWSGSPQVLGDSLFLDGPVLLELDRTTGGARFLLDTVAGSPTDGTIRSGSDGALYVFHPDLLTFDPASHVFLHARLSPVTTEDLAGPPAVLPDGRVVIQDDDGAVWLFRPEASASGFALLWKRQEGLGLRGVRPENADPQDLYRVAYDATRGLVYVNATGSTPGASATVALDVDTGGEVWRTPGPGLFLTLLMGGRLVRWTYLGGSDASAASRVQLLDSATGEVRFDYGPADLVATNVGANRVYVTWPLEASDGSRLPQSTLTALDDHLAPLWTWTTPKAQPYEIQGGRTVTDATIPAPPAVASDGRVFVTTRSCHLFALSADGTVLWADTHPYRFGAVHPVVYRGMVYAVSQVRQVVRSSVWRGDGEPFQEYGLSAIRAYPLNPPAGVATDGGP